MNAKRWEQEREDGNGKTKILSNRSGRKVLCESNRNWSVWPFGREMIACARAIADPINYDSIMEKGFLGSHAENSPLIIILNWTIYMPCHGRCFRISNENCDKSMRMRNSTVKVDRQATEAILVRLVKGEFVVIMRIRIKFKLLNREYGVFVTVLCIKCRALKFAYWMGTSTPAFVVNMNNAR